MAAFIIVAVVCGIVEGILLFTWKQERKRREKATAKTLYKLLEERVLSIALCNNVTHEQAASREYYSPFLQIEFKDAKPWYACVFSLDEGITIGRSKENKVWIRSDTISRVHCKIALVNGYLYLQDLGAANGTCIRRGLFRKIYLRAQQTEVLESGDFIMVGNYKMRIRIRYGYEAAR